MQSFSLYRSARIAWLPAPFEEPNHAYTTQPSPIKTFPSDLLVKIVMIVLELVDCTRLPRSIEHLRLVCKRWCQVIDSVPEFWNTLRSISPTHGLSAALNRSSDLPLDIVYSKGFFNDGSATSTGYQRSPENMATLLVPHSARWRSVSVRIYECRTGFNYEPKLGDVRTYAMPNLKRLEISGIGREVVPWDDFGGHQPHLQSLVLRMYSIPWNSGILLSGTLQHLCISEIRAISGIPTAAELSTILSSSPHLITVEIHAIAHHPHRFSGGDLTTNATPILLPELLTFCCELESNTLIHILPRLHIPACTQLKVKATGWLNHKQDQINLVVESLQARLAHASADLCNRIIIRAERNSFQITTELGFMDVLNIQSYQMLRIFMGIYSDLRSPPTPQRTVALELKGLGWRAILDLIADEKISKPVTSVILHGGEAKDRRSTLKSLMKNVHGGKLCPSLRYLRVQYDPQMAADIVRFAARRCVDGSEIRGGSPPVQLCLVGPGTLFDGKMQELERSNKNVVIELAEVS